METLETISQAIEWRHGVSGVCVKCDNITPIDLPAVFDKFGDMTLTALAEKLACKVCNKKGARLQISGVVGSEFPHTSGHVIE